MGATDLTASVDTTSGGPASPCYLIIEPDSVTQREVIYFDGTFTGTTFVTGSLGNRYLTGSAAGSGLTHPSGSIVESRPLSQHLEDVHDRIDAVEGSVVTDHGGLGGRGDDDHTQYLTEARHAALADASGFSFVVDEDDMVSDDDTKVPTQQSVKAYVDDLSLTGSDVQTFTTSGTWTKPTGAVRVLVDMIGAGGGGAGGTKGSSQPGGGGGGGGARHLVWFDADDLDGTEAVTIGAGGAGGAASANTTRNLGADGGASTFAGLTAGGGGGGQDTNGGKGGGTATSAVGSTAGLPRQGLGIGGAASDTATSTASGATTGCAEWAGGGGALTSLTVQYLPGSSLHAGSGGGQAAGTSSGTGTRGGLTGLGLTSNTVGAAGGISSSGNGVDAADGTNGVNYGDGGGGAGGTGFTTSSAGAGGDGNIGGGGGGGGSCGPSSDNAGAGGDGGDGYAVITTFFD